MSDFLDVINKGRAYLVPAPKPDEQQQEQQSGGEESPDGEESEDQDDGDGEGSSSQQDDNNDDNDDSDNDSGDGDESDNGDSGSDSQGDNENGDGEDDGTDNGSNDSDDNDNDDNDDSDSDDDDEEEDGDDGEGDEDDTDPDEEQTEEEINEKLLEKALQDNSPFLPARNPHVTTGHVQLNSRTAHFYGYTDTVRSQAQLQSTHKAYLNIRKQLIENYRLKEYSPVRLYRGIAIYGRSFAVKGSEFSLKDHMSTADLEYIFGGKLDDALKDPYKKHVLRPEDATFSLQLRNILRDNAYDRMLSGRKRGTLDGNMLYKVPANDFKVFRKKEARKNKNYHFSLIVDQSGSMRGKNIREASHMAVSLQKAFAASDVDYSVYGHSSENACYQRFGVQRDPDALYNILDDAGGSNNEYAVVVDAYKSFPTSDPNHNFVFLLSDGGMHPNTFRYLCEFLDEHRHVATFIYVGIGGDAEELSCADVEIMGGDVAEAKKDILKEIRKRVIRG